MQTRIQTHNHSIVSIFQFGKLETLEVGSRIKFMHKVFILIFLVNYFYLSKFLPSKHTKSKLAIRPFQQLIWVNWWSFDYSSIKIKHNDTLHKRPSRFSKKKKSLLTKDSMLLRYFFPFLFFFNFYLFIHFYFELHL